VSGWSISKSSHETSLKNKAKLYMKHLWKIIYTLPSFLPDWTKAWSLWAILVSGWLKFIKSSPLKLEGIVNGYFV
jgi:hypothetical protein